MTNTFRPEPMPNADHLGGGVKASRFNFKTKYVKMWMRKEMRWNGRLLGHTYNVRTLPMSPRHAGMSEDGSVGLDELDRIVCRPVHWINQGWRQMSELPPDWEEHNAKLSAERHKLRVAADETLQQAAVMSDLASTLKTLLGQGGTPVTPAQLHAAIDPTAAVPIPAGEAEPTPEVAPAPKKKRGRPKGSKNKPTPEPGPTTAHAHFAEATNDANDPRVPPED